jgi:hypothetical protein
MHIHLSVLRGLRWAAWGVLYPVMGLFIFVGVGLLQADARVERILSWWWAIRPDETPYEQPVSDERFPSTDEEIKDWHASGGW